MLCYTPVVEEVKYPVSVRFLVNKFSSDFLVKLRYKKSTRWETLAADIQNGKEDKYDRLIVLDWTCGHDFIAIETDLAPDVRIIHETCEGCKHLGKWENEVEYGYPSPCTGCKRRAGDRYER